MKLWMAILLIPLAALVRDDLTPAEFEKLHAALKPDGLEKWQAIPWKVDLLEARAEAIKAGKPLFMWSMNGHPLGCT